MPVTVQGSLRSGPTKGELTFQISSRELNKLQREVQKNYVQPVKAEFERVTAKYADLMYEEALKLVPVDTGNLKASITLVLRELGFLIYTDVTYAAFVEFGTSLMAAQPFMLPAFQRYADVLYKEWKRILTRPLS